ncbi:MAG: VOC family protein [Bacteroidota bacterium]
MIFEHLALNVREVRPVLDWYVRHLGLEVASEQKEPPFMTFLADGSGRVMMELYQRPDEAKIDFGKKHPLTFHLAFISRNAFEDKERLQAAGATFVEEVKKGDGSHLIMLRDPWGMPLQLCQRTTPL